MNRCFEESRAFVQRIIVAALFPGCWADIARYSPEKCEAIFDNVKAKVLDLARECGFVIVPAKAYYLQMMALWQQDDEGHAGASVQQDWGYAAAAERFILGLIEMVKNLKADHP
jgi:hypothetical protein